MQEWQGQLTMLDELSQAYHKAYEDYMKMEAQPNEVLLKYPERVEEVTFEMGKAWLELVQYTEKFRQGELF